MKQQLASVIAAIGLVACAQNQQFGLESRSQSFASTYYNNKVDVLFMVDNSTGMESANATLQNSVPTLVTALLGQGLDLHVGVVTSSLGGTNPNGGALLGSPRYFTNATPNLAGSIISRISGVGNDGSDLERGLDSIERALSPASLAGASAGFLRSDALLAVIALSTEDDKGSDLSGGAPAYASFLDALKGNFDNGDRRWVMNFIGVTSLTGSCNTMPELGYKEPGQRWIDLAATSGGTTSSICASDLSLAVVNIHTRIAQILTDYPVRGNPDLNTIRVTVNGVVVPQSSTNGWSYLPSAGIIRFNGTAIPKADQFVNVDFTNATAN